MQFRLNVDTAQIANELKTEVDSLQDALKAEIKTLAIRTHAHIVEKARSELTGFMLETYLGRSQGGNLGGNLRLTHISDTLHVIELDEKASWIEDGRPPTFMGEWLLKSPKAKTAKDGSKYLVIPMTLSKLAGTGKTGSNLALDTMSKAAAKQQYKGPLKKIAYDASGRPVGRQQGANLGRVEMQEPSRQVAGFFSQPRSAEMAKMTGLKEHSGIFYGQGAHIRQKQTGDQAKKDKANMKGKTNREIGTFRVISSKHEKEGRWMYPKVEAFGGIKNGYEWAQGEMNAALATLGAELGRS